LRSAAQFLGLAAMSLSGRAVASGWGSLRLAVRIMSYGKWDVKNKFLIDATLTFRANGPLLKGSRLAGDEIESLLFGILLQLLQAGARGWGFP
jgi:hypothetical protein